MRKTFFVDIDGTLLKHIDDFENIHNYPRLEALPDAAAKTTKWHCDGHLIILTTARPESLRSLTEQQLRFAGILYDQILMGIGAGERILINDTTSAYKPKATAHNVLRNIDGLKNVGGY